MFIVPSNKHDVLFCEFIQLRHTSDGVVLSQDIKYLMTQQSHRNELQRRSLVNENSSNRARKRQSSRFSFCFANLFRKCECFLLLLPSKAVTMCDQSLLDRNGSGMAMRRSWKIWHISKIRVGFCSSLRISRRITDFYLQSAKYRFQWWLILLRACFIACSFSILFIATAPTE